MQEYNFNYDFKHSVDLEFDNLYWCKTYITDTDLLDPETANNVCKTFFVSFFKNLTKLGKLANYVHI